MAKVVVTAKWSDEKKKYVPDKYSIEGDGNISISYALMSEIEPEYGYVNADSHFIQFGPYRLEIIAQSRNIDGEYLCRLVSNATDTKATE